MEGRGKALEVSCRRHPNLSSVGICPLCLKEKLLKLASGSEYGKQQRISSCSSSGSPSSQSNSGPVEVGRISFLIENDRKDPEQSNSLLGRREKKAEVLRRSSSSCIEGRERSGFWAMLFRKRRDGGLWVADTEGVSRSRSLRSFWGDDGDECVLSRAKISDVENGVFFPKRNAFPAKETDFSVLGDSDFIDLNLDFPATSEERFCFKVENMGSLGKKTRSGKPRCNRVWKWISRYRSSDSVRGS